jgi:hypothetical protein
MLGIGDPPVPGSPADRAASDEPGIQEGIEGDGIGDDQDNRMDLDGVGDNVAPAEPLGEPEAAHPDNNLPDVPPLPPPPRRSRPRKHGYAAVEVQSDAARIIRWEYADEPGPERQPDPADPLQQKRLFEVCEWLMHLPISNSKRAEYFNLEMACLLSASGAVSN